MRKLIAIFAATASVAFGAWAGTSVPVPLTGVAHASRLDDETADGKGGWLDLGSNDLRVLPAGTNDCAGVPFVIPPCTDAETHTCLVLGRRGREAVKLRIPSGVSGGRLFLLHACADEKAPERKAVVGTLRLTYANGSTNEFRVRTGRDIGDWTCGRSFKNAVRAWTAYNGVTQVSLFLSSFDLAPRQQLESVVFTASGECPWMVVAATAGRGQEVKGLQSRKELTGTFRAPSPRTRPLGRFPAGARPKNAILIIGDGMGPNTVRLASLYQYGRENALQIQQMPIAGLCTTMPLNAPVTDSAAAATAFATGTKTSVGVLGLGVADDAERKNPRPLVSVAALMHARGGTVALVTNDRITGATPAAFYAHVTGRGAEERIAEQAAKCGYDILVGARRGLRFFRPESNGGQRKDGRDVLAEMEREGGYASVTSQVDFAAVPCGRKTIGFFLEEALGEESVAAAMRTALARMGDASKGFFMLAETSTTDHGNHRNDPSKSVLGALQAEWAASAALDFAEKRGDTLVIVTADHETGGLSVARSPDGGKVSFHYAATSHTHLPVAVFAYGPGAENFEGLIDNTDIARSLKSLLGLASTETRGHGD